MTTVLDIFHFLNQKASVTSAMSYDNVGLLVGDGEREVHKVLTALDITDEGIREAERRGASLIVSHHPVIFEPLKRVVAGDVTAEHVMSLVSRQISAICMHTNLDAACGGVNDCLAAALGLSAERILEPTGENIGIGRVGALAKPMAFDAFLRHTMRALSANGLRYHKAQDTVTRVAVGGGSCGSMLALCKGAGCDTFVTADIKHSQWLEAAESGINLIDAGHFATENVVIAPLTAMLAEAFPHCEILQSETCREPMQYIKNEEARHGA